MNKKCNYSRKLGHWEVSKRNTITNGNYSLKESIGISPEPAKPDTIRISDSSLTIKQK